MVGMANAQPQHADFAEKSSLMPVMEPWQYALLLLGLYVGYRFLRYSIKKKSDTTAGKNAVEKQAEAANSEGAWHSMVFSQPPNRDAIINMVKENPESIHSRGPVGETICHFLLLLAPPEDPYAEIRTEICKELIEMVPSAIDDIYTKEPYTGENLLHIAIVNRNDEMVKWLVEKRPKLMEGRATGSFFSIGSNKMADAKIGEGKALAYFGEFPLSFAACTNQANLVEYLINKGADLLAQDTNGNNVLHMCVIWQRKEMYGFVSKMAIALAETDTENVKNISDTPRAKRSNSLSNSVSSLLRKKKKKDDVLQSSRKERLLKLHQEANTMVEGGLTCLTLAAWRNDPIMFDWMLENSRQLQWSYGTVSCYLIPLVEIDWIRGKSMGAIEWIVDMGHKNFFKSHRMKDLLELKWHRFAEAIFMKRLEKALTFMFGFSFMIVFDSGEYSSIGEMLFVSILEIILCWGAAIKLYEECLEISNEGFAVYLLPRSLIENACSFIACGGFVSLFISRHVFQFVVLEHILRVAIACAGWTYMFWFLLGNRRTGHFVVMIFKMIYKDVIPFSIFTSVFLFMFSMIFFLLFEVERSFDTYTKHMVSCFDGVIGNVGVSGFNIPATGFVESMIPRLFSVIFTIMCIILLNLLVAMMGDTYGEISQDAELEWHKQRAGIIFSIEQNMTDAELEHPDNKYWVDVKTEKAGVVITSRYLQVEEENPDAFQEYVTTESLDLKTREKEEATHLESLIPGSPRRKSSIRNIDDFVGMQHQLEAKLEAMFSSLQRKLDKALSSISDKIETEMKSSSIGGINGTAESNGTPNHDGINIKSQMKMEAKLDLFASTTSELMKKNAELEVQLTNLRSTPQSTPRRRPQMMGVRRVTTPAAPQSSSSLFQSTPGQPL